jgi:hypothetical protein
MPTLRRPSLQTVITGSVVALAVLFVFSQLQPSLLFANTTPSGGDMGAHVWLPAFLRDHLLHHGRITGWAPDWYAGFPALTFYFPLPSLLIVLLDVVLPYGVAFKLVTVLGVLSLPVAAYMFGRLSRMAFPGPALLAVATVPFLFDRSPGFTIWGGNIPSTLAGEFSFSIGLSIGLVFLGVVARGLETGRHRVLAAVLLTLTGLCHVIPTLFVAAGAAVLLVQRADRHRARYILSIFAVAGLVVSFWLVPFALRLPYANDMGWEKITDYSKHLFPQNLRWVLALAAAGTISAIALWRRAALAIVAMAMVAGVAFLLAPEGRLWNARFLPFWYLCLYLLAAVAVSEISLAIGSLLSGDPERPLRASGMLAPVVALAFTLVVVSLPLERGRAAAEARPYKPGLLHRWLPIPETKDSSFIPSWVRWNYTGYERKPAYPEYKAIVATMAKLPCGRAMWEYESKLDRYGTPMALMLLPYWTHGCIGSMEGLFFESSATTPYHFLNQSELSKSPSNPQRDLPYQPLNVAAGVRHLQLLGVRYYMASSDEAKKQAREHPDLRLVATSGPWEVYEVADAPLVEPLAAKPAVLKGLPGGARPWLDVAANWYQNPANFHVVLAAEGPRDWPRVRVHEHAKVGTKVGSSVRMAPAPVDGVPAATVSHIRTADDRVSFDVDRVGTPVLVKTSYFPNWGASGARGPWRVTPNLMVVIPTSNHVSLHYGYTPVDALGWLLTLLGIAGLVVFARRGPVDLPQPPPAEEPVLTPPVRELDYTSA